MEIDHGAVGEIKPLSRALAHGFGCKKWFENMVAHVHGDARAIVLNPDFNPVFNQTGAEVDTSPTVGLGVFFGHGMGCVNDQIEEDLADFMYEARDFGKGRVKIGRKLGHVFPFVARDIDRVLNQFVHIC